MSVVPLENSGRGIGSIAHLFLSQAQGQTAKTVRIKPSISTKEVSPTVEPPAEPLLQEEVPANGILWDHLQLEPGPRQEWEKFWAAQTAPVLFPDADDDEFLTTCPKVIWLCSTEPKDIIATYSDIKKRILRGIQLAGMSVCIGPVADESQARRVFDKLAGACHKFLRQELAWEGCRLDKTGTLNEQEAGYFAEELHGQKPAESAWQPRVHTAMVLEKLPANRGDLRQGLQKALVHQEWHGLSFSSVSMGLPGLLADTVDLLVDQEGRIFLMMDSSTPWRQVWQGYSWLKCHWDWAGRLCPQMGACPKIGFLMYHDVAHSSSEWPIDSGDGVPVLALNYLLVRSLNGLVLALL